MVKKQRHFLFTHNNYTAADVEKYKALDCSYIIFGYEIAPTTGTPHLQGYFHSTNPRTLTGVIKEFPGAHITIPNGPPKAQRDYCSKSGNFYEQGTLPMSNIEKGEAGKDVYASALAAAKRGDFDAIPPTLYTRYYRTYKAIASETRQLPEIEDIVLYPWQEQLLEILKNKPHPRRIHWRWSYDGGVGKSTFSLYLVKHFNATVVENGKSSDLAYMLPANPTVVIFDLPRTSEGHINYGIIESIKNGCVFSPKYDSRTKYFNKPHVIVFANFEPNMAAWSPDRYDITQLDQT